MAVAAQVEPPRGAQDLADRFATWWWPATQMAMAAAIAWMASNVLLEAPGGYGPITAIVAMGLGRERRIWRSVVLVAGLLLGTGVAEVAGFALGVGWWQVGIIIGLSGLLAGLLFDRELAVTYATINAVVLHSTPGAEGWVPTRLLDGMLGVLAALVVTFGIAPSRPHRELARRLRTVTDRAAEGLELAAEMLRRDVGERLPSEVRQAATNIDHELARVSGTVDHALDLARWAPLRRRRLHDVEVLVESTSSLVEALTTASTIVRLADRAIVNGAVVGDELPSGIDRAAAAIRPLLDAVIRGYQPDRTVVDDCHEALEGLLSEPSDRAVVIAVQEEVRGLLDDVIDIADRCGSGSDDVATDVSTRGATTDGVRFGDTARRRSATPRE